MLPILNKILPDPPPPLVFEVCEGLLLGVRRTGSTIEARARRELSPEVVTISPVELKIVDATALRSLIESMLVELAPIPRPTAALLLPDAASRLAVLDFETLPSKPEELRSLVEFRLKKTVPFEIAAARLSYQVQKSRGQPSVLAAATAGEVVWPFEEIFTELGLHLGFVSLSSASMLSLVAAEGMTVVTRLSGSAMTMAAVDGSAVRLVRSVESRAGVSRDPEFALPEFVSDLFPTFAYIEDNMGAKVSKLLLAGFGSLLEPAVEYLAQELNCVVEPLRSSSGNVGEEDAGIQGYLEAA